MTARRYYAIDKKSKELLAFDTETERARFIICDPSADFLSDMYHDIESEKRYRLSRYVATNARYAHSIWPRKIFRPGAVSPVIDYYTGVRYYPLSYAYLSGYIA